MSNPYYDNCGLITLESKDNGGSYEFDMAVLWKHDATGRLFYGFDSGCSCPAPFEDHDFTFDDGKISTTLEEITAQNWEGAAQEMEREHFEKGEIHRILRDYFKN